MLMWSCEFVTKAVTHGLTLTAWLLSGAAPASLQGRWDFATSRGALLIVAYPSTSELPDELLVSLKRVKDLEGMCVVREVISCPAYSLYLSSGSECP